MENASTLLKLAIFIGLSAKNSKFWDTRANLRPDLDKVGQAIHRKWLIHRKTKLQLGIVLYLNFFQTWKFLNFS
jgi:hypothetical protein